MNTRFALAAMALVATFAVPAYADITAKSQDGTLELTLPNGWKEVTPQGEAAKIVAKGGGGTRLVVRVYSKADFKDMKSLATFTAEHFKLEGAKPNPEDIKVNGKPGVRVSVTGTEPNGMRVGLVITVFEVDGNYLDVIGRAPASAFTKQGAVLAGMANQLRVVSPGATDVKPPVSR